MVRRDFIAQHFLTVPDCGPENEWHSHHFELELLLEGSELNEWGYLVDIDDVKAALGIIIDRYKDSTMNDLPEFKGLNPSVEHFARIVCTRVANDIHTDHLDRLTARIWEDEEAWASYTLELGNQR